MGTFISEWGYRMSKDSPNTRKFYLMVTIALVAIWVCVIAALAFTLIGHPTGLIAILGYVGVPVALVVTAVLMLCMRKLMKEGF